MTFPLYVTSPLPYAVVLPVVLAIGWRHFPGGVRYTGIAIEILLVVMTMPLGASGLAHAAVAGLPSRHTCRAPPPRTIVVLSTGFHRQPQSPKDFEALSAIAMRRLFHGIELWRKMPDAKLVISGGGGPPGIPEALPLANLAMRMGVPGPAIRIEGHSHTTWQNAQYVAALSPPLPRRIWLVTSAMHMPRSLRAFRAWGFAPCASPSGMQEIRLHFGPRVFIPQGEAVRKSTLAVHEMVGDLAYIGRAWWHARHER
jgi:uncharacterized SAM-binding protein YcdF (DUF218 family)